MKHITPDRIYSYTEGMLSGPEALDTEGHIATCERCHGVFSAFKDVESGIKTAFKAEPGANCPEDWEVASIVTGESGTEEKKGLSHMDGCDYCLGRAAVYYKAALRAESSMTTPSEWAERAVGILTDGKAPEKTEVPLLKRLWQSVQRISKPLPPLPGYAIGAMAIILLVWVSLPGKGAQVMTITSSERIVYRDAGPSGSFAFMGGESEKMEGMKIAMKGQKLFFNWRPIDGAAEYQISIRKVESGASVAAMTMVSRPKAVVDARSLERGELYLWVISGKAGDGRIFEYMGKFLLTG
ncbi:MAG: zf-HC2 domain-containing protein [Thermodesulfobacteriota bacterium]